MGAFIRMAGKEIRLKGTLESDRKEATIRALLLGAVLSVILGAANTYLGLYAGMTVSASIPAAVISMTILRVIFRKGTVRENNIVQSVTSAGESLAAGVIFTIPALLLVGVWNDFQFWPVTLIAFFGGLLGIIFMIPLRRTFITERKELVYPEGVACAEVLQAGEGDRSAVSAIAAGTAGGFVLKLLSSWFKWMSSTVEGAFVFSNRVIYAGIDLSAALAGVGYIVRFRIAVLIFTGGAVAWLGFLPAYGILDDRSADAFAWDFWNEKIRYIGVGAMLVGAVQSLFQVRTGLFSGFGNILKKTSDVHPTQKDMPFWHLLILFLAAFAGTIVVYEMLSGDFAIALVLTLLMVVASWLFVALAAYIVGFVGSSNSPVSGLTITALLLTSGAVLGLGLSADRAMLSILGVAGLVCCATCTAGDISQDLKTGSMVGATPWKQQWAEVLGIAASAPVFAALLTLLNETYGIGTGEPGSLKAPQAALFAGITQAVAGAGNLPLDMVLAGVVCGLVFLGINLVLHFTGHSFRFHVMPVAVGIYLPVSLSVAILAGGILRWFADRKKSAGSDAGPGVLFASGLIAGESLAGIFIAILITNSILFPYTTDSELLKTITGLLLFGIMVLVFNRFARKAS